MRVILYHLLFVLLLSACSEQVVFENDHPLDRTNPNFIVMDPTAVVYTSVPFGVGFRIHTPPGNVDSIVIDKAVDGEQLTRYAAIPFSVNAVFADTGLITEKSTYRFRNMTILPSGPSYSRWIDMVLPDSFMRVNIISTTASILSGRMYGNMSVGIEAPSFSSMRVRMIQDDASVIYNRTWNGTLSSGEMSTFRVNHTDQLSPSPGFVLKTVVDIYVRLPDREYVIAQYVTPPAYLPFVQGYWNVDEEEDLSYNTINWYPFLPSERQDLSYRLEVDNNSGDWNTYYLLDRNVDEFSLYRHDTSLKYRLQLVMGDSLHPNPYYFN
jgi:hypothetical protein